MLIEIVNWEKYNPRHDVKKTSWFRLENDFWSDPTLFVCDNDQKMVWLTLLSLASQRMSGKFDCEPGFIATVLRIDLQRVLDTINFLESKEKLRLPPAPSPARRRNAPAPSPARRRNARAPSTSRERTATNDTGRDEKTITPPVVPQSPPAPPDPPRISRAEQRAIDRAVIDRGAIASAAAATVFAAASSVDDELSSYSTQTYVGLDVVSRRLLAAHFPGGDGWGELVRRIKRHRKTRSPEAKLAEQLRDDFLALAHRDPSLVANDFTARRMGETENSQQEASP